MVPAWRAVELIRPHVFRISTPRGSGTGFLLSRGNTHPICSIATAAHVVSNEHLWGEPIRIEHLDSSKSVLLNKDDRSIRINVPADTAAIAFDNSAVDFPLPDAPFPLCPKDRYVMVGSTLGWLGYPSIRPDTLCYFAGSVSAWFEDANRYLVDGVSIHGVSGGPAFFTPDGSDDINIIGVVSGYHANVRARGETLPGLAVVSGVHDFYPVVEMYETMEQARLSESAAPVPAPTPADSAPLVAPTDAPGPPDEAPPSA